MKARKVNKTVGDVKAERDAGRIELINYGGKSLRMEWGWNEAAITDRMVKVIIGDEEAIISAEEFMRFLRWA
jgi:hypothetical protein